jgi:transposase
VLDNCAVHHQEEVALSQLLAAAGVVLVFLPPYSPHLNPIELYFNTLRYTLRTRYPTSEKWQCYNSIVDASADVSSRQHMMGYYAHCGY